ncbi:DUF4404 family protein [Glaciimonas immobilis]|uniref:DUF4404 family protein n=1 Tax=Glaciimonas immobilis TaxID=728004 RepID=A0A840RTD1_9BURK|nr:DUF4404 family protein [Glaciimonas immobilis]KAF3996905.1 DUF4404 family protein [Glaciimonas immobilis]MBB5199719.1 hypothetical protein [Glaciimonas immobilis]
MSIDNLKESLQKLHVTLENGAPVDPETRALLQTLDADIQRVLSNNDVALASTAVEVTNDEPSSDLVKQAQKISARLAVRHPHLEPVFRDIADMLTKMGI